MKYGPMENCRHIAFKAYFDSLFEPVWGVIWDIGIGSIAYLVSLIMDNWLNQLSATFKPILWNYDMPQTNYTTDYSASHILLTAAPEAP